MADITFNGMTMEFDVVASMMDTEIKAAMVEIHGNSSEQELLDAYILVYKEDFGSDFLQV